MRFGVWVLFLFLLPCRAAGGEQIVYIVSTGENRPLPLIQHTKVYAIDPDTGREHLMFSDRNLPILLLPGFAFGGLSDCAASGGSRIFARGVERSRYQGGYHTFPASVFELTGGDSGVPRKIFDIPGRYGSSNFRQLFASPSGDKVGYTNYLDTYVLVVHASNTGKILHSIQLAPILRDCFVESIGWMPNGKRLFFTAATGDEHVTSDEAYALAGSYVMNEDGSGVARLPRNIAASQPRKGYRLNSGEWPVLQGVLPDGRYLFNEYRFQQGPPYESRTFLYTVNPASRTRRDLIEARNSMRALISPSGRRVLIGGDYREGQPQSVRVLNLDTGAERRLPVDSDGPIWRAVAGWVSNYSAEGPRTEAPRGPGSQSLGSGHAPTGRTPP